MEEIIIDEEFNVDTKKVVENEYCRIVIDSASPHMELTKYTEVSGEEEVYKTAEVRYIDYWLLDSEEEYLSVFDELWNASYLLEEVQLDIDREVVINRKHWEIVLGRIVDKLAYVNDEGIEFFNPVWEHKYLPFYPHISTQDLIDQFEQFWELEPYTISAFAVPTGDYEIAGQVLEDVIDLGVGYENLSKNMLPVNCSIEKCGKIIKIIKTTEQTTNSASNDTMIYMPNIVKGSTYNVHIKLISSNYDSNPRLFFHPASFNPSSTGVLIPLILDDDIKHSEVARESRNDRSTLQVRFDANTPKGTYIEIELMLSDSDTTKPFIKNSRPDSKLALPQLSSLGSITSKEMRGNHLVAQHENGTAIIKNAVVNPNAPNNTFWWGIQPYYNDEGNKRLFCSTADGTYPTGWANIKYDADGVFYDVGRTSTSNNIAGLIYEEDGKLKVYIGEGYENLGINSFVFNSNLTKNYIDNTTMIATFKSDLESTIHFGNPIWGSDGNAYYFSSILKTSSSSVIIEGANKIDSTTYEWNGLISASADYPFSLNVKGSTGDTITFSSCIKTKTSIPKPFTEGIVPNGALKVACDWTSEDKSYIFKNISGKGTVSAQIWSRREEGFADIKDELRSCVISKNSRNGYLNNDFSSVYTLNKEGYQGSLSAGYLFLGYFPAVDRAKYTLQSLGQILIYNNPNLTRAQLEGELAKDINLPTYHHQPNSVINTYGITGMSAMYLYQPAITSAEIDEELEKDIYLPVTKFDIPNYKGE